MNRLQTILTRMNEGYEKPQYFALRSRSGAKVHKGYSQGPSFCGVRAAFRLTESQYGQVRDQNVCDKCYGQGEAQAA